MSDTDFSTELTALLARHERATHVIAIDADAQIDPRHIKMLCVATGVDAFPLSAEQVAVNCPGGVPQALSDLPVQIGGLDAPADGACQGDDYPEDAATDADDTDTSPDTVEEPAADAAPVPAAPATGDGLDTINARLDAIQQALTDQSSGGSDAPDTEGLENAVEQIKSLATGLGEKLGGLDASADRIETLAGRLDSHPVLTVDLIEHRKSVARFATAAGSVLRRIESVANGLEQNGAADAPDGQKQASTSAGSKDGALAQSLLTLCTELLTMSGKDGGDLLPELKEIRSAQDRLAGQISELQAANSNAQGEALQDLRLAVAEILADGQRQNATENSA